MPSAAERACRGHPRYLFPRHLFHCLSLSLSLSPSLFVSICLRRFLWALSSSSSSSALRKQRSGPLHSPLSRVAGGILAECIRQRSHRRLHAPRPSCLFPPSCRLPPVSGGLQFLVVVCPARLLEEDQAVSRDPCTRRSFRPGSVCHHETKVRKAASC